MSFLLLKTNLVDDIRQLFITPTAKSSTPVAIATSIPALTTAPKATSTSLPSKTPITSGNTGVCTKNQAIEFLLLKSDTFSSLLPIFQHVADGKISPADTKDDLATLKIIRAKFNTTPANTNCSQRAYDNTRLLFDKLEKALGFLSQGDMNAALPYFEEVNTLSEEVLADLEALTEKQGITSLGATAVPTSATKRSSQSIPTVAPNGRKKVVSVEKQDVGLEGEGNANFDVDFSSYEKAGLSEILAIHTAYYFEDRLTIKLINKDGKQDAPSIDTPYSYDGYRLFTTDTVRIEVKAKGSWNILIFQVKMIVCWCIRRVKSHWETVMISWSSMVWRNRQSCKVAQRAVIHLSLWQPTLPITKP